MIEFEDRELRQMGANLTGVTRSTAGAAYAALGESATDLRDTWRRNAKQTAGKAARRYSETVAVWPKLAFGGIEFEIYPDERINGQANLAPILEFGSPTSPAHLDGQLAMAEVAPRMEKRVADAVAGVFQAAVSGDKGLKEYTTKAGVTRMATQAQIDNWTRGNR